MIITGNTTVTGAPPPNDMRICIVSPPLHLARILRLLAGFLYLTPHELIKQ